MLGMDGSIVWRAALIGALSLAAAAAALGAALPRSFFEDYGWIAGPAVWAACALLVAVALRLPPPAVLAGAALAGLPSLVGVLAGVHWVGAPLGLALLALWCGRLAARREKSRGPGGRLMDLGLAGRVALVTGGSRGIGHAIAAGLAAEGARVAIAARDAERVRAAAAGFGGHGVVFDSDDLDAVPSVIGDVESALGPIDIYVANTGGPPAGEDPLGFTREQWEAAHRTLVLSPMAFLERLLPGMRERGWGRVVGISSMAVREPIAGLQLSNAHRPGLIAAFKVLARRVAADGVTINSVLPGRIATERIAANYGSLDAAEAEARDTVPAGRLGTADELAAAAIFLCSAPASYITGTTLLVDGGLSASV